MEFTQDASCTILDKCQSNSVDEPPQQMTIHHLAVEILLEIFDSYRLLFEYASDYVLHWNSKSGWFKLAHVCRRWRQIVLLSSSRLDVKLVLTLDRPMRAVLKRLSTLPIVVHYPKGAPTASDMNYMIAAIRCRDRVHGITFRGERDRLAKFLRVMTGIFPVLESLHIHQEYGSLELPSRFLGGSAPNLQELELNPVRLESLARILPLATGLVELSLSFDSHSGILPSSLLAHLQGLPHLSSFQLYVQPFYDLTDIPTDSNGTESMVWLSKLTEFHYSGHDGFFEALIARLAAPSSLEETRIVINHTTPTMLLHLTRFIDEAYGQFSAVQLIHREDSFSLSLLTDSPLLDTSEPNFMIKLGRHPHHDLTEIVVALSARLSVVEGLLLTFIPSEYYQSRQLPEAPIPWDSFFLPFRSVKTLAVHPRLVPDVAHSLIPGHGPNILPVVEEIGLLKPRWGYSLDSRASVDPASMVNAFQPFVASRQQAGRPVTVSWKVFSDES